MSAFKINVKSYDTLLKLFQEFYSSKNVTADEFIEAKLVDLNGPALTEAEIEKFVLLVTHKSFLDAVKNNFVQHLKIRNYNEVRVIMVIFILLFASDNITPDILFAVLKETKCAFKGKLLEYFCNDNNLIQTALTGCKFFGDDYVLSSIIHPVLNKAELFKKTDELLFKDIIEKRRAKPPTVPEPLSITQSKKIAPTVPLNTPRDFTFHATEVPKSIYKSLNIEKRLAQEFEKNRVKSEKLLAQAKALDKNFAKPKKPIEPEEPFKVLFRAKKAPVKKPIEVRGNVATVLKEASLCINEKEKEIKQLECLLQGGSSMDKYREIEESLRKEEEKKNLNEIEKKHLEGMLSFEDAILAKKKLVECNKERYIEFLEEREEILEQIEKWKSEEQERMKVSVKKCQEIERKAKESEKRVKREKQNQAQQFKEDTKMLLQEAFEKQQEELARKAKLIEEIKTLHQLKSLHVKEFDRNETPNLGLLCEMSINELQKKLTEMRVEMERELESKRKCIQYHRFKQREMIQNVKNFITQTRMSKPKRTSVPIRPPKLAHSPDLDKLRGQLENARALRKSDGVPEGRCPVRPKLKPFSF